MCSSNCIKKAVTYFLFLSFVSFMMSVKRRLEKHGSGRHRANKRNWGRFGPWFPGELAGANLGERKKEEVK